MGDSLPSYVCSICSVTCTGPESLQSHLSGVKHMKRERQSKLYGPVPNSPQVQASQSLFQSQDYSCKVCQTIMSGPEAYLAHMNGKPHAKKLKQQELIRAMSLGNASLDSDIQQEAMKITPANGACSMLEQPESLYFCRLCAVPLSGPESAKSHYDGAQHLKRQKRSQYVGGACSIEMQHGSTDESGYLASNIVPHFVAMNGSFNKLHLNDKPKNISKEIALEADGTEELRETYRQSENEVVMDQEED